MNKSNSHDKKREFGIFKDKYKYLDNIDWFNNDDIIELFYGKEDK